MIQLNQSDKHTIDIVSVATVVAAYVADKTGVILDSLPTIALLVTIIWTIIRIFETDTVRGLLGRKKNDDKET